MNTLNTKPITKARLKSEISPLGQKRAALWEILNDIAVKHHYETEVLSNIYTIEVELSAEDGEIESIATGGDMFYLNNQDIGEAINELSSDLANLDSRVDYDVDAITVEITQDSALPEHIKSILPEHAVIRVSSSELEQYEDITDPEELDDRDYENLFDMTYEKQLYEADEYDVRWFGMDSMSEQEIENLIAELGKAEFMHKLSGE
jgi:hypothetical protein